MPSAAARVFAIQELLDQILGCDCLSMKDLYRFQAVNKQFCSTLNSPSNTLPVNFELYTRYLTNREYRNVRTLIRGSVLNPALRRDELQFRPFNIDYTFATCGNHGTLSMSATLNTETADYANTVGLVMGLRSRKSIHSSHGSWGRMKLGLLPITVILKIQVDTPSLRVSAGEKSFCKYRESSELPPAEATLGNLIAALEAVRDRSYLEHLRRSHAV